MFSGWFASKRLTAKLQLPTTSPRIQWSDHVQVHFYEIEKSSPAPLKKVRRKVNVFKQSFRDVYEAKISNRQAVTDDILIKYICLLPSLRRFDFHNMSLADMESKQIEIINELDGLQCKQDPDSTNICTSETYKKLEDTLLLLLEAADCLAQKANIEQLAARDDADQYADSDLAYMKLSFKSKHATRHQISPFKQYMLSKKSKFGR